MAKRTKAYLALLTVSLVWGAALPIVKPALEFISPTQFLFFRYLITAPILLPFLIYYLIKLKPSFTTILKIVTLEFFSYLALIVLYQGLKQTSAIEASLIGATGPIFTVLGGIIFLKEKEESQEWKGLIISFLGTLILVFEPLLTGRNHSASFSFTGNLLIILYNLSWTTYLLIAKKHYQSLPKFFISSLSYQIGLLTLFTINLLSSTSISLSLLKIPAVFTASFYMAIFGSIVGFTLYLYALSLIEASETSLFTYLQGVVAIPFSVLLLNEAVTSPMILAIFIISLGVYLAQSRPKRLAQKNR